MATLADGTMRGKEEHIAAYKEDFETYSALANSVDRHVAPAERLLAIVATQETQVK